MTVAMPEIEHTVIIPINTFAPLPIEASRPIQVVIQNCEDEYVASFFDANISASGETLQIALDNLKDLIAMQFQFLEHKPNSELGTAMRRKKSVLLALFKRRV